MKIDTGYVCKKCGKVYHKKKENLPRYCTKCGCILSKVHFGYMTNYESGITTIYDDYSNEYLTENVVRVKLVRKWLRWKVFEEKEV